MKLTLVLLTLLTLTPQEPVILKEHTSLHLPPFRTGFTACVVAGESASAPAEVIGLCQQKDGLSLLRFPVDGGWWPTGLSRQPGTHFYYEPGAEGCRIVYIPGSNAVEGNNTPRATVSCEGYPRLGER